MKKIPLGNVASLDVDCQKGFTPLCPDELPVAEADKIVPELNAQAKWAGLRIGSKDAHPANPVWLADKNHPVMSALVEYPDADVYWPAHCVVGTKGFELLDGLPAPEEYDFFVWKGVERHIHPYGACFHDLQEKLETGIFAKLEECSIDTVIVGGIATDYCVATTCRQLLDKGFRVILNLGACRGISPDGIKKFIDDTAKFYNEDVPADDLNFVVVHTASDLEMYIEK